MPAEPGTSETAPGRRDSGWIPWVLVPLVFILYALHPTRWLWFDGVVFAAHIEHGNYQELFNPHHLLYTWLFYLIHNTIESTLNRPIQALFLMQWANIVLGAIGVGLMWTLLSRLIEDRVLALLVTLLACFSFSWWHYSTDADAYILSTCLLLLAAIKLEGIVHRRTPRNSDFIQIGLLHASCILFHQLGVLFIGCVAGCLFFSLVPGSRSERIRWWWIYFASMVVPLVIVYIGIGILVLGQTTPGAFLFWITEYGRDKHYWIKSFSNLVQENLNGYLKIFLHRDYIGPEVLNYDLKLAWEEGRFWKGILKVVFGHISLGFLFFCVLTAIYNLKKYALQFPGRALFVFSWFALYVPFQLFYYPGGYNHKIFILVPILALFAWIGKTDTSRETRWLKYTLFGIVVIFTLLDEPTLGISLALIMIAFEVFRAHKLLLFKWGLLILVVFVGVYNYIEAIAPESTLERNPEVAQALALVDNFQEGDILIFEGGDDYPDGWIITALTPARALTLEALHKMSSGQREAALSEAFDSGGRVYVHPNITEGSDALTRTAVEVGVTTEELLDMLDAYEWRDSFVEGGRKYIELVPDVAR